MADKNPLVDVLPSPEFLADNIKDEKILGIVDVYPSDMLKHSRENDHPDYRKNQLDTSEESSAFDLRGGGAGLGWQCQWKILETSQQHLSSNINPDSFD